MAKNCKVLKKINLLDIDDKYKEGLRSLLLVEDYVSSDESIDESVDDDNDINAIESSSVSSDDDNNTCLGIGLCDCSACTKHVNVISRDKFQAFIDVLEKIEDQDIRAEYVSKLRDLIDHEEHRIETSEVKPYNFKEIMGRFRVEKPNVTVSDLQEEIRNIKQEINWLKEKNNTLELDVLKLQSLQFVNTKGKEVVVDGESDINEDLESSYLHIINKIPVQKWKCKIHLSIRNEFHLDIIALIDSGADSNCIREGLIPTQYYEKTSERLSGANGARLNIQYKISSVKICNDKICFKTPFVLVKNISEPIILGTPFLALIYPFSVDHTGLRTKVSGKEICFEFVSTIRMKEIRMLKDVCIESKQKHINLLNREIHYKRIEEQLETPIIADRVSNLLKKFEKEICAEHPNAFWDRKKHVVTLPYEEGFDEKKIPTKARPIQMNQETLEYCKKEIQELLDRGLIRASKSPWSCSAFYVFNQAERERGAPRMVINFKPLNKVLRWIRYPLPNKKDLITRIQKGSIFSKFDMKSGYYQIQIAEEDKYKTAFTVPFGHYEWNVMPFGLKNAPSEFQHIMNDIFNPFSGFIIVYIDDVLVFSNSIEQHFKHLDQFYNIVKESGLVVSAKKMKLFLTKIRFLGFEIYQGTIQPISRSIEFSDKFPDKIIDKNQLQRFLGCLNYVSEFIPNLRIICKPLFSRLRKNPPEWSSEMTQVVRNLKQVVKSLPCLGIPDPEAFMIIETDASDIGYGGILKQKVSQKEQIVRYHSGTWNEAQSKYSTIKKEILAIVLCITKFQEDVFNKKFLLRVDCKAAKDVLQKDVQNLVSKHIFARWQAILACFDFDIEHIKGSKNALPDFLTREFLQGKRDESLRQQTNECSERTGIKKE